MKTFLQLLALATIVLSAVACSGGSDAQTPQVVKMGVDDASKMRKKDDAGNAGPDASKKDDKVPAAGGDAKAPASATIGKDAKAPAADAPKTGG